MRLLGTNPPPGLVRSAAGWRWNGQSARCHPTLPSCEPTRGLVAVCSTADRSVVVFPDASGGWRVEPASMARCVADGWGGVELP